MGVGEAGSETRVCVAAADSLGDLGHLRQRATSCSARPHVEFGAASSWGLMKTCLGQVGMEQTWQQGIWPSVLASDSFLSPLRFDSQQSTS